MVAHTVLLRSPDPAATTGGVAIVQRTDQNFLASLSDELGGLGGLDTLPVQAPGTRNADNVLTLFQPVHRTFYVALLEVVCDTAGSPRVDPARIDSAGLVVRRRPLKNRGGAEQAKVEGWMEAADAPRTATKGSGHPRALRGWVELQALDLDPDPARRPLLSGHPEIDRQLALVSSRTESLAERVTPLFLAHPELSAALGKTLLYGLVPVTSSELSEAPATFTFDLNDVQRDMPQMLRSGLALKVPHAGGTLTAADVAAAEKSGVLQSAAEKLEAAPTEDTDKDQDPWWSTTPQAILAFVAQLRQITIEFGAFEAGTAAQALYDGLNKIELSFSDGSTRKAGEFLKEAASVLLGADVNPPEFVTMPRRWPVIETKVAETLAKAVRAALSERATRVAPHEGRFAQASREYVLRAFVRVRSDDGCPPKTFWSELSKSFTIAPWYAASEAPPVPIALPDPTDRRFLAQLKPNVAFVLPKPLFNLLKSDPKKLMVGDASIDQGTGGGGAGGDQGPDVSWICGFNIPIITICAFIVLNIFLSLFNLIFWWLPFVKICIPLPKRSPVS